MIVLAAAIGAASGLGIIWAMQRAGMLADRSGMAVLVAAIAFFYPVFAVMSGEMAAIVLHTVIFFGFTGLAVLGFHRGMYLLAGGLIGHGLFDLGLFVLPSPAPEWWPAFCGALDITAGIALIRLMQQRKIAL